MERKILVCFKIVANLSSLEAFSDTSEIGLPFILNWAPVHFLHSNCFYYFDVSLPYAIP